MKKGYRNIIQTVVDTGCYEYSTDHLFIATVWSPPVSYSMGTRPFPGLKQPGCGTDYPPPASNEVKEGASYTSTPPLGLHGLF
jgi:hypothetical protein